MSHGMDVCKTCHKSIHELVPSEKKLGRDYNTKAKLLAHPEVKRYVKWKRGHSEKTA
jgi:hypothetical protein